MFFLRRSLASFIDGVVIAVLLYTCMVSYLLYSPVKEYTTYTELGTIMLLILTWFYSLIALKTGCTLGQLITALRFKERYDFTTTNSLRILWRFLIVCPLAWQMLYAEQILVMAVDLPDILTLQSLGEDLTKLNVYLVIITSLFFFHQLWVCYALYKLVFKKTYTIDKTFKVVKKGEANATRAKKWVWFFN